MIGVLLSKGAAVSRLCGSPLAGREASQPSSGSRRATVRLSPARRRSGRRDRLRHWTPGFFASSRSQEDDPGRTAGFSRSVRGTRCGRGSGESPVRQALGRQLGDEISSGSAGSAGRQPAAAQTQIHCSPNPSAVQRLLENTGEREISTTMAFVQMLGALVRDRAIGKHIVPIVPDESRTFGMEGMFRQLGIYSSVGQLYRPQDADQLMYYREDKSGQVLQEGINEGGAMSSWIVAATSYSTNNVPMIPFYIFYSMFGLQRVGDLAWLAGDMRARSFLLGGRQAARRSTERGSSTRTAIATFSPVRFRIACLGVRVRAAM